MEYQQQYSDGNDSSRICLPILKDAGMSMWNALDPKVIHECFEETILIWFPCVFLWLFTPLEIYFLRRTRTCGIPLFSRYNTLKLVIIAILGAWSLVDIAFYFLSDQKRVPVVDIYTTAVTKILTFGLLFALTWANIKRGVTSSGILFTFSLALALCGTLNIFKEFTTPQNLSASKIDATNTDGNQEIEIFRWYAHLVHYSLTLFLLLLSCFADTRPVGKHRSYGKNPCPEKHSSFLSRVLFAWSDRLVWKGFKRCLKYEDLWDLDDDMQTATIVKEFESKWNLALHRLQKVGETNVKFRRKNQPLLERETDGNGDAQVRYEIQNNENRQQASIVRPLYEVYGSSFWIGVMLIKLVDSSLMFASPLILNSILIFVEKKDEVLWHGCLYAVYLLSVSILGALAQNYYLHQMYRAGLRMRTALISAVYKKALKISNGARKTFSLGEIINLIAVDAQTFTQILPYFPYIWFAALEIIVAVYWLWNILGVYVLAGIAVMIILTVANCTFLSRIQKLRVKQMKYKDRRLKLTNEVLSGIKILKLYACEPSFEELIVRIREDEIKTLKTAAYFHAGSIFTWICSSFLLSFITFGLYTLRSEENVLDAQITFVSLSLFNLVKRAMEVLPLIVSLTTQTSVAVKRISEFLNLEELDPKAVSHDEERTEQIVVENGEFSWESDEKTPTLSDINVKVNPGTLIAIVGSVGAGKSSLLSAILGEMYKFSGYVNTKGKLAYVPQQAWIRNTTLRENITFGGEMESAFYDVILEACALTSDLEILPDGDRTEIGEKGVNLSGGQKQRVSLARALYSKADAYLLDDPLSAVDVHVGKHIFEKVIGPNGLLKDKTRVLVTHNVTFLPQVDHILVLQNGSISESGTYEDLLKKGGNFANFLATHLKENDKSCEDADENKTHPREDEQKVIQSKISANEDELPTKSKQSSETAPGEEQSVHQKLTESEEVLNRHIGWTVHVYYLRAIRPFLICATILANVLFQTFTITSNYCLSEWASIAKSSKTSTDAHATTQYKYLSVYALYGVGEAISVTTHTIVLFVGTLEAAKFIHDRLLNSVLHWPLIKFDHVPLGRILNRFGYDLDVLDTLSKDVLDLSTYVGIVISSLIVISFNTPMFVSALVPLAAAYYSIQYIYSFTTKQLKRLESATKSPIYSHFGDTIAGIQSIRAYNLQTMFTGLSEQKIDFNQRTSYGCIATHRWYVIRLELLGTFVGFGAALFAILARNTIDPALVGLSVSYALEITGNLFWLVFMFSAVKTNFVALERIKEYTEMEQEAPWIVPEVDERIPSDWPHEGEIVFERVQVRYHEGLAPVLDGVDFRIKGGEKIGIVGRTGAGKSSLMLSLFRIIESVEGKIIIDGVDVSKIGLHMLRGRLTIIPQDPVLFSGSMRMNLDPESKCSDESIWKTLELVNLKAFVSGTNFGLQHAVEDGGNNLSVGQRQLICLARALLRKTKVLIMDEATAAVDLETDELIQATIRKEFHDCTVLTIAHRLNTVLDYDRIMVLDRGRIVEFDSPAALLDSRQSIFRRMMINAGLA